MDWIYNFPAWLTWLKLQKKWYLLIYNVIIWLIFLGVYSSMMTPEDFNVPNPESDYTTSTAAYFSVVVHSTVGFGDIYPKSSRARTAVTLHIALVVLGSLGIYLLPIESFAAP